MYEDSWIPLEEFPDFEINLLGLIRRASTGNAYKQIHPGFVQLKKSNGKNTVRKIAPLVIKTFLGYEVNPHRVRHKDGDVTNNILSNLEVTEPVCKRGHKIVGSNRMNGAKCRACEKARQEGTLEIQRLADNYYDFFMKNKDMQ